jgi:hypothetical protein
MYTECTTQKLLFKNLGDRRVEAEFTADRISTDAGGLLIREVAAEAGAAGEPVRRFTDFQYETLESWTRQLARQGAENSPNRRDEHPTTTFQPLLAHHRTRNGRAIASKAVLVIEPG